MRRKFDYDKIFQYIIYHKQHVDGLSPSYREIMLYFGIASTSTVGRIIETLEREGKIVRTPNGIAVTGGKWIYEEL